MRMGVCVMENQSVATVVAKHQNVNGMKNFLLFGDVFRMCIPRFRTFETMSKCLLGSVFVLSLLMPYDQRVLALELELFDGQVSGHFDTRTSIGFSVRVEDRDPSLIGIGNGGTANSLNGDNGNLNYKVGDVFSASAKATHELALLWKNYEFFGRFFYFYDVAANETERTGLSETARGRSVRSIRLLDAYGVGNFDPIGSPITVRVGNQVISWGESTFIANGINTINPVDVSKFRVAGAELREGLLPVPAIDVNVDISDKLSVEAYYQFVWRRTEIDPEGTFFSTNDFISPGSTFTIVSGSGTGSDNPPAAGAIVPRGKDRDAPDFREFGLAVRIFAPAINETEFGLYYIHYHSRLPLISATRATTTGSPPTATYFTEYPDDIDLIGGICPKRKPKTQRSMLSKRMSHRF